MERLDKLINLAQKELDASDPDKSELSNIFQYLKKTIESYFAIFTDQQILQPNKEDKDIVAISNFHSGLLDAYYPVSEIIPDEMAEALEDQNSYYTKGYNLAVLLKSYGIRYESPGQSTKILPGGVILFVDYIETPGSPKITDEEKQGLEEMFEEWHKKIEDIEKEMRDLDDDENDGEEWKKK